MVLLRPKRDTCKTNGSFTQLDRNEGHVTVPVCIKEKRIKKEDYCIGQRAKTFWCGKDNRWYVEHTPIGMETEVSTRTIVRTGYFYDLGKIESLTKPSTVHWVQSVTLETNPFSQRSKSDVQTVFHSDLDDYRQER